MNRLKWWLRVVGGFYLLLGIGFIPTLNAARLPFMLPGFDASVGGVAYRGLLDFTFMFGLDMIVTGAFLLYASREPLKHISVAWLVVALEIVRGILDDVYMIAQGYAAPFYVGFIVVHLIIIVTGIVFMRQASAQAASATSPAPSR